MMVIPNPILVIDHGYSLAKACLFEGESFRVFKIPLGFKASEHLSVLESLLYIIGEVEREGGVEVMDKNQALKIPIFVSGEIASVELKGFLKEPPFGAVEASKETGFNLIDIGCNFTFLRLRGELVTDEGLREGIVSREKVSAASVMSWLPSRSSLKEVENYIQNKGLYLPLLPATMKELYLEQAIAREKLRYIIEQAGLDISLPFEANPLEIILSGGVLSGVKRLQQAVYIFLDGFNLSGVYKLLLDTDQVVSCLGTLKHFEKERAEQILRSFPFSPLGTVISLVGSEAGESLFRVTIDSGLKNLQEMLVKEGDILLFPLAIGEAAAVQIDSGGKGIYRGEVEGGEVGVVIDARGKPLQRPVVSRYGWELIKKWDKQLNAHGQVTEI